MFSQVGACVFVWGFDCPENGFVVREVGLCNVEGTHHTCFHYNLPQELPQPISPPFHGLRTKNEPEFRPHHAIPQDIEKWLAIHLTPKRPKVAVHPLGIHGTSDLNIDHPLVMVDVPHLESQPIGTVGALPSGQQELLCDHHFYSHNHRCARLMACRLSAFIRSSDRHMPTLSEVNTQRVLWQQRADALMDLILCDYCQEEKNEAYTKGEGIQWVPNCDWPCKQVARILEEGVYEAKDFYLKDRVYEDEALHKLWAF